MSGAEGGEADADPPLRHTTLGKSANNDFSDRREAEMGTEQVATGRKINIEGHSIEFYEKSGKWLVRHNGQEKGEAKPVNVDLSITLDTGLKVTPRFKMGCFLVYQHNPTCASYWNGSSWVQYCW